MTKIEELEKSLDDLRNDFNNLKEIVHLMKENDDFWKSQIASIIEGVTKQAKPTPKSTKEKNAIQKFFTPRGNEEDILKSLKGY